MTMLTGTGRPLWVTAPAAAPPGRWSGSSSRPPLLARIRLICCCAATTTGRPAPPWPPPAQWSLTTGLVTERASASLQQAITRTPIQRRGDEPALALAGSWFLTGKERCLSWHAALRTGRRPGHG